MSVNVRFHTNAISKVQIKSIQFHNLNNILIKNKANTKLRRPIILQHIKCNTMTKFSLSSLKHVNYNAEF